MTRSFADTNILLYVYDATSPKRAVAEQLVMDGLVISTQSLNECANVMIRKLRWSWPEIRAALTELRELSSTLIISDLSVHEVGMNIAERYRLSVYDALIVAAALKANCEVLFSEDMHHGLIIHDRLTIINPFRDA